VPFMPCHWGPATFIGLALFRLFDFPTLLVSCVILDAEPMVVWAFNLDRPLHGVSHSFLVGAPIAILVAAITYLSKSKIRPILADLKLAQDSSFAKMLWSSFVGVYSHIVLDAPLYTDIRPFWPSDRNPLYGPFSDKQIYMTCFVTLALGAALYGLRLLMAGKSSSPQPPDSTADRK